MKDYKPEWKCCVKEPSELGKKVLCQRNGDFYVAMRFEEYYIPLPFSNHYYCKKLCKPETWCEIPFSDGYKGYIKTMNLEGTEIINMREAKEKNPEAYWKIAKVFILSIGTLTEPEINKNDR